MSPNLTLTMTKILVPLDFTPVSDTAIQHAENLARHMHGTIHLLHVVSKESQIPDAERRLGAFKAQLSSDYPTIDFEGEVREGNIFEDIADVALEIDARLIVMGTHGMRGMQFLVGSNALRIVSSSVVPIIIVQERKIREEGYDDILVPLDLHKETKQKLHLVLQMAQRFSSRVHLISPKEDDEFLRNTLERNMTYASQFFEENDIEYTTTISEADSGDFAESLVKFAVSKECDIIAIMNLQKNSLVNIIGGSYTQRIITNEAQIPVILLNPKATGDFNLFTWPAP
jgi:nucleotide-binding universal stress UspA family protein